MSFKKFLAIFVLGITISIGFVFFLRLKTRDTPKYLSSKSEALPPIMPRSVDIPDEVRKNFAKVPDKPELIAAIENGGRIESVEFSPVDSSLLVSRSSDNNVKIWRLNTPTEPIAELKGNSVSFSPDGEFLALSSLKDGTKLWNIRTRQNVNAFSSVGRDTIFSPDGKWLAIGTIGGVQLWDIRTPTQPIKGPKLRTKGLAEHLSFSADAELLSSADRVSGDVDIWKIDENKAVRKSNFNVKSEKVKWVETLKFLPDAENPILAIAENDKNIHLLSPIDWQAYSDIAAGYVNDLAFSSDAKILVSGGHNEIELWTVENGERVLSIDGYSRWVNCVDISHDRNYVAGGANDGILRVWEIDNDIFSQQNAQLSDVVKLIYFLPSDRAPRTDIQQKLNHLINSVQKFFADEMERHGFGRKTVFFEKNGDNSAKVYLIEGRTTQDFYFIKTDKKVRNEVEQVFDSSNSINFIVVDISNVLSRKEGSIVSARANPSKSTYIEDMSGIRGGEIITTVGDEGYSTVLVSRNLGYTFGLNNNLQDPSYIMSYGRNKTQLSKSSAEWLNKSRYFNSNQTFYDTPASIEKLSPMPGKLRFQIQDANGIHQVRLLVKPTNAYPPTGYQWNIDQQRNKTDWDRKHKGKIFVLQDYLTMNAKEQATVTFDFPEYAQNQIKVQIIDIHGNIAYREINLIDEKESTITSFVRRLFPG